MGGKDREGSNVGLPTAMPTPVTEASQLCSWRSRGAARESRAKRID